MTNYLVWNIKEEAWQMEEFIGFTEECEFAGIFSEDYLIKNTGIFNTRTGDYASNVLVNATTLEVVDLARIKTFTKEKKHALKRAITKERKRRVMPVEYEIKDGKKICPYCRKDLVASFSPLKLMNYCKVCGKPVILEKEEW